MINYSHKAIKTGIIRSLNRLLKYDHYLLENDVNERSVTHKLAEYLSLEFYNWNVDCEFNKMFKDPKIITYFESLISENIFPEEPQRSRDRVTESGEIFYDVLQKKIVTQESVIIKRIFPDIIVHLRGSSSNLLVIELKKSTNKSSSERNWDMIKLKNMTQNPPFNYRFGAFIDLPCGPDMQNFNKFSIQQIPGYRIFEIKK